MHSPSFEKRLLIMLAGYFVVLVFAAVFIAIGMLPESVFGQLPKTLSVIERMIISGIVAAPVALALIWGHIKGLKLGEVEITLGDVTPVINIELASSIQDLKGSETPLLVNAISDAIAKKDVKLVEVNLRSSPYWWSTRLYLLAALANEYTEIERLVFVEQDNARIYVGMAKPLAVRNALSQRFPAMERVFTEVQGTLVQPHDAQQKVQMIGFSWPSHGFPRSGQKPDEVITEREFRELVGAMDLREWLGNALETESRQWNGTPGNRRLYARILTASPPYVPLLQGRRLEKVVDRCNLASRIAVSAVAL